MSRDRLSPWAVVLIVLLSTAAFAFPFLQIFLKIEPDAVYNSIAADTFYYLKLSDSFVNIGFPSMDETDVSNGYMPLWQLSIVLLDLLSGDTTRQPEVMIVLAFTLSFALAAFGIARLSVFVCSLFGLSVGLMLLALLMPGAAFWFLQNTYWMNQNGGQNVAIHAWSFANGMESGICLAVFSLIVPRVYKMTLSDKIGIRAAFILGALCFLALLGRLDDVFVGIACGLFVLVRCWRQRTWMPFLCFAAIPILGSAAYVGINYATAGIPLPTSGMSKIEPFFNGPGVLRNIGFDAVVHVKTIPSLLGILVGLGAGPAIF